MVSNVMLKLLTFICPPLNSVGVRAFFSYGINVRSNILSEKSLRVKLDI